MVNGKVAFDRIARRETRVTGGTWDEYNMVRAAYWRAAEESRI